MCLCVEVFIPKGCLWHVLKVGSSPTPKGSLWETVILRINLMTMILPQRSIP